MGGISGARWQDDDQLHLTLRFIGKVDGRGADDLADALAGIRVAPFDIGLSGVGWFDRKGRIDALWAGGTAARAAGPPASQGRSSLRRYWPSARAAQLSASYHTRALRPGERFGRYLHRLACQPRMCAFYGGWLWSVRKSFGPWRRALPPDPTLSRHSIDSRRDRAGEDLCPPALRPVFSRPLRRRRPDDRRHCRWGRSYNHQPGHGRPPPRRPHPAAAPHPRAACRR